MKTSDFLLHLPARIRRSPSCFTLLLLALPLAAQQAAVPAPDEVVVSIFDRSFTAAEVDHIRENIPLQFKRSTQHMDNRSFLETFGYLQALAKLANDESILEQEPYKTQFAFNKTNFLAQTYLQRINRGIKITEQDKLDYYNAHAADYRKVRVSAIILAYDPVPEMAVKQGRTPVLEADALAEAQQLIARLKQGEDFAELAREHSDEGGSSAKGGDMGFFTAESQLAPAVKTSVFQLAVDEISEPIKEGGRFYVFKATEVDAQPLEKVAAQVMQKIQGEKLTQRLDEIRKDVVIESKSEAYLNAKPQ